MSCVNVNVNAKGFSRRLLYELSISKPMDSNNRLDFLVIESHFINMNS